MKKIGLVVNASKDINLEYTDEIIKWLNSKNYDVVLDRGSYDRDGNREKSDLKKICTSCEFIIVLGGDGTILEVARESSIYDLAILGINLGTLGYLTDVDRSEGIEAIEKVLLGKFTTQKRMMIEAEIVGKESCNELIALNDICIMRGSISKMINLDIMVNNEYIDTYRADGIIISTPTGSTAYNLSAGGPILKPDTELIAITPICPHKMYSRSSVVSGNDEVNINVNESHEEDIILSLDGQVQINICHGDRINIRRSRYYTTVIKTSDLGFYDILRKKFYH